MTYLLEVEYVGIIPPYGWYIGNRIMKYNEITNSLLNGNLVN